MIVLVPSVYGRDGLYIPYMPWPDHLPNQGDTVRYGGGVIGMVWYGMVRYGKVRYDERLVGMVWYLHGKKSAKSPR